MHSKRSLLMVAAAILSMAALAPAVAASGPGHSGDLHVTKECSLYVGQAGGYCTITSSNLKAIPVGSKVIYVTALAAPYTVLDTDITLDPPGRGDVAFGHVHLDLSTGAGEAVFTGGTGEFAGFTASVDVTPQAGVDYGWRWDGTYKFTHANFYLDKTCGGSSDPVADPLGYVCTVQHSSFKLFPAGTKIHYVSQTGNVVQAVIKIPGGRTTGACVWSSDVDAICTFGHGTGRLAGFHLRVVVSANAATKAATSVWYWDGTYTFTHRGHSNRHA
jgi:hypothetical protein